MATFRMRYVQAYADRHGRQRYYYRRPGYPRVALPGEPGSKAFAEAYEDARTQKPRRIGEDRIEHGSFSWLIAQYYDSAAYGALKPITKQTYRYVLERFRQTFGDDQVKSMTPKRLDELLEATDKNLVTVRKVLRLVLKLAVRRELIKVNPMDGLRLRRTASAGFRAWTEADIALYLAKWPSGSRERLALALLLYTAQRRADVPAMGRQHVKGGKIRVVQSKGGAHLWIPAHPALQAEIDAAPKDQLTFLQTQYGKPFTVFGFGKWFGERAKMAGCPEGCTAHGLRKAGSRRLAEAGCTPHQIMAITGHKNLSEVTLYTASVDQERLADEAIERTKTSNPGSPVRQNG
jgi:site-specific recombinase XerD